jgi:hypothetical protein
VKDNFARSFEVYQGNPPVILLLRQECYSASRNCKSLVNTLGKPITNLSMLMDPSGRKKEDSDKLPSHTLIFKGFIFCIL